MVADQRGDAAPPDEPLDEFSEKLAAFNALRKSNSSAADTVLEELSGGYGKVEREIVQELAAPRSLAEPDRFEEAHHHAVRAIEVLYRNGYRAAQFNGPGAIKPVINYLQQQVSRFIVRSHVNDLVDALHDVYTVREAESPARSEEALMLRRARMQMERIEQRYKGKAVGLPAFVLGGAAVSTVVTGLSSTLQVVTESDLLLGLASLLVLTLFLAIAWAILRSAAITRRRIRLTTEKPLQTLYRVVGAVGDPPKDQAKMFALMAMIVMAIIWLVVPGAVFGIISN